MCFSSWKSIPGWNAFRQCRGHEEPGYAGESMNRTLAAMGRIVPGQRWGLGADELSAAGFTSVAFKGGWGPEDGGYVARQLGILTRADGRGVAVALLAEVERSKRAELWRFIAGLSIPQVGPATAKLLARHYGSLPALAAATQETLPPALGESAGRAVLAFFASAENRAVVDGLLAAGVAPTPFASGSGRLDGKIFAISGRLPTLSREAVTRLIESEGGTVRGMVTAETDYVVIGRDAGIKLARARELQVPVIDEATLRRMLEETAGVE